MKRSWGRFIQLVLPKKMQKRLGLSNFITLADDGMNKTMYKVSFGQVKILQNHLGRTSSVSIPLDNFQSLSQEIKKVHRKVRKSKR